MIVKYRFPEVSYISTYICRYYNPVTNNQIFWTFKEYVLFILFENLLKFLKEQIERYWITQRLYIVF
ncbi:MAG: hypothetical protein BAJALOKI1v1_180028 [Promethearchaeota archaeon]|nr:MAG: hypothetical protein BAJALOKI1v1_180028 [Candidatus Lokiarchaeota archaeon]